MKGFSECFRVLKKGGAIRMIVPDLELLVAKYLEKDVNYFRKVNDLMSFDKEKEGDSDAFLLADILMDNFYPHFYKTKPRGINKIMTFFVRSHCWMYDYPSLKHLLKNAGFEDVRRRSYREGEVSDLDHLDVFPEMSLYLEAEK